MIPRSVNHGLHVIQLCLNLIFLATTISSSSYRLIVAITLSPLYRLNSTLILALFGTKVPCVTCKSKQFTLIVDLQRLFIDQRLFGHGQA